MCVCVCLLSPSQLPKQTAKTFTKINTIPKDGMREKDTTINASQSSMKCPKRLPDSATLNLKPNLLLAHTRVQRSISGPGLVWIDKIVSSWAKRKRTGHPRAGEYRCHSCWPRKPSGTRSLLRCCSLVLLCWPRSFFFFFPQGTFSQSRKNYQSSLPSTPGLDHYFSVLHRIWGWGW